MHGSATTTPNQRADIQQSGESIRVLAERYGVNPKTVAKWKNRAFTDDLPMGPRNRAAPALSPAEEAMCVAFRKHAMLPLDDCLYALQLKLPHLKRSTLHRLFQRHHVSRLPAAGRAAEKAFRNSEAGLGDFYVDTSEVRTGDGIITMFVAFDQASTFAYAQFYEAVTGETAAEFLVTLIDAVPQRVCSVLTSDSAPFADVQKQKNDDETNHPFAEICRISGILHKTEPTDRLWMIDQRAAPARRRVSGPPRHLPYESHTHLRDHFLEFFDSYNFSRRLKSLHGLTPYRFLCREWREDPGRFRVSPIDNPPAGARLTPG